MPGASSTEILGSEKQSFLNKMAILPSVGQLSHSGPSKTVDVTERPFLPRASLVVSV